MSYFISWKQTERDINYFFLKTTDLPHLYSQPEFACSKLTIETLEQGVKYVHS